MSGDGRESKRRRLDEAKEHASSDESAGRTEQPEDNAAARNEAYSGNSYTDRAMMPAQGETAMTGRPNLELVNILLQQQQQRNQNSQQASMLLARSNIGAADQLQFSNAMPPTHASFGGLALHGRQQENNSLEYPGRLLSLFHQQQQHQHQHQQQQQGSFPSEFQNNLLNALVNSGAQLSATGNISLEQLFGVGSLAQPSISMLLQQAQRDQSALGSAIGTFGFSGPNQRAMPSMLQSFSSSTTERSVQQRFLDLLSLEPARSSNATTIARLNATLQSRISQSRVFPSHGGSFAETKEEDSGLPSSEPEAARLRPSQAPCAQPNIGGESSYPVVASAAAPSTFRSASLYMACDEEELSPYQCLVRKQLELFEANEEDVESNKRGRNKPILLKQVGIRCKHCRHLSPRERERAAIYYPAKLERLYQAGQTMANVHLGQRCKNIPAHIREELSRLREGKNIALAGKKYWADGARVLGVKEDEHCLRFE